MFALLPASVCIVYGAQGEGWKAVVGDIACPPKMSVTMYWGANYVILSRADDLQGLLLLRNTTRAALEKGPPQYLLDEIDRAHEAQEQLAFADLVLLNKIDLVGEEDIAQVEARIRAINPTAKIIRSERCHVALEDVLGRDAFSLDRVLEIEPEFLKHGHHHHHDDHVTSFSLLSDTPLDPQRFFPWIQSVAQTFGPDMLRMKGIIAFEDDDDRFVMQGVHMLLEGNHQRPWSPEEPRTTRMVFIGRDLPRNTIEEGFRQCFAMPEMAGA